ncbi:19027_t:CDS:2 [Funneliformis geosporum]|uniref:19027_t:CDS:1 n=1 Tax=Funneliformis geosporum TaxID=1117311 RepID=A0A9W4WUF1_9GLOM|nr:19027_t:CDS:2 [Funneliformis geosporum]
MLALQINKTDYLILQSILTKYPCHFYAYGSRVKGTARKFSDLDLCFKENIPSYKLVELEEKSGNSDLPFMVELPTIYHPGKILKEEFLIPAHISLAQLTRDINVSSKLIKEIIAEERDLDKDIATRLSLYFSTAPTF